MLESMQSLCLLLLISSLWSLVETERWKGRHKVGKRDDKDIIWVTDGTDPDEEDSDEEDDKVVIFVLIDFNIFTNMISLLDLWLPSSWLMKHPPSS